VENSLMMIEFKLTLQRFSDSVAMSPLIQAARLSSREKET